MPDTNDRIVYLAHLGQLFKKFLIVLSICIVISVLFVVIAVATQFLYREATAIQELMRIENKNYPPPWSVHCRRGDKELSSWKSYQKPSLDGETIRVLPAGRNFSVTVVGPGCVIYGPENDSIGAGHDQ